MSCALSSLKVVEGIALILGVAVMFLLSDVLNGDLELQEQVHDYVVHSTDDFKDFLDDSKSFKGISIQTKALEVMDFVTKNMNWEYASLLCQGVMICITMIHIGITLKSVDDMIVTKFAKFQVISKVESYLAAAGAVCLLISVTYSDDKRFVEILQYTFRRMKNENKPLGLQIDTTMEWFCPLSGINPLITGQDSSIDKIVEKRTCEYGHSKYVAMVMFLIECIIHGLMYNYAKAEKARLGRIALARFVADRTPVPLPTNAVVITTNNVDHPEFLTRDCPPPYETLILNIEAKPMPQTSSTDGNLQAKTVQNEVTLKLDCENIPSQFELPSYESALNIQGTTTGEANS